MMYQAGNRSILMHLDLDQFYAAVEIRANPELEGKPLLVGNPNARTTRKGVVLTCSYEAREYGIHSGMSMHEALTRCPHAVISRDASDEYRITSKRIMQILKDFKLPIAITSIDEAYFDLSPLISSFDEAYHFAKLIQKKIFKQEKLTCSIGIAPTLKIAKMGSEFFKPNGITIINPELLKEFFDIQKLTSIPGIGKKTGERLKKLGYTYCGQLFNKSELELQYLLGSYGNYLFKLFKAKTSNRINIRGVRKSISHERTFHGQPGDYETYNNYLSKLFKKTTDQMLKESFLTKTIGVKIRYNGFKTITRAKTLTVPTDDLQVLREKLDELIINYLNDPRGIRLLGVKVSNLEKKEENQQPLNTFFKEASILKIF